MKEQGKENKKKKLSIVYISICMIGVLLCGINYAFYYTEQNKKIQEYEELRVDVRQTDIEIENSQLSKKNKLSNSAEIKDTRIDNPIDFTKVWEQNKDVYAWIQIPGTVIDYPILQHTTDNYFYLNHNMDGSKGYPGCIYSENFNQKDFSDFNTVLYGHNMKNGSMFAGLHHYADTEFFELYKEISIYTPETKYTYEIFGAYTYDDRHILSSFNFENSKICNDYIEDIFNRKDMSANFREENKLTEDSKILTLSTCIKGKDDKRFLVQAVLINEDETK